MVLVGEAGLAVAFVFAAARVLYDICAKKRTVSLDEIAAVTAAAETRAYVDLKLSITALDKSCRDFTLIVEFLEYCVDESCVGYPI